MDLDEGLRKWGAGGAIPSRQTPRYGGGLPDGAIPSRQTHSEARMAKRHKLDTRFDNMGSGEGGRGDPVGVWGVVVLPP